jgi:hypothetical protein
MQLPAEVALKEVAYAGSLNKRFAPIVCREVSNSAVPESLRRLNLIYFIEPAKFDANADALTAALRTRSHTNKEAWADYPKEHPLFEQLTSER